MPPRRRGRPARAPSARTSRPRPSPRLRRAARRPDRPRPARRPVGRRSNGHPHLPLRRTRTVGAGIDRRRGGRRRSRRPRCRRSSRSRAGRSRWRPRSRPGRPSSRPRRGRRLRPAPARRGVIARGHHREASGYPGDACQPVYVITYARMSTVATSPERRRLEDPGPARGDGPIAARPRRALRGERADALAGRARRDQPDPAGGHPDRRRPGAAALAASAARRGRSGDGRPRAASAVRGQAPSSATATRSSPRRCPASAPSSRATCWRPERSPAVRATRPGTSLAAARPRWWSAARSSCTATASGTSCSMATASRSTRT